MSRFAFTSKPELVGFGLNYKRTVVSVVGNLLKGRCNVESPRRDLCFVHAHLSTNAKTEQVTKECLLLSQNENEFTKKKQLKQDRALSKILPSWDV